MVKKLSKLKLFKVGIILNEFLRGLEVSVLAFGTQVRGFKPGRRIFRAKNSSALLPLEGK
jgi:hypothetical protein